MEINATVVYTEKNLNDFIQFSLFRGKYYKAIGVLLRILGPLLFLAGVYYMCTSDDSPIPATFIFGIFLIVYMYITPLQTSKRSQKTVGALNRYIFYETEFHIDTQSALGASSSQLKYNELHSVYETNEYIYLFNSTGTAHIVDKSVLPVGLAQELHSLLSKQVKKYVVCQGCKV